MGKKVPQTISVNPKRAVVLLSGGIDSSTTLAFAKNEGYELYALSFDYFQRHGRELESARMVASSLGVKKYLVIRFNLRDIGGSALTSEMEVPKRRMKDELGRKKKERGTKTEEISTFNPHPSFLSPMSLPGTPSFSPSLLDGLRSLRQYIFSSAQMQLTTVGILIAGPNTSKHLRPWQILLQRHLSRAESDLPYMLLSSH